MARILSNIYQLLQQLYKLRLLPSSFVTRVVMRFSGVLNQSLIVFDIDAVGLREHFDPVINWLIENGSTVLIAVDDTEVKAYRAKGVPKGAWCLSKSLFEILHCTPAVTISFHAENGSSIASRLQQSSTQRVVMQHGLSDKAAFGEIGKLDPLSDFDVVFLAGPVFRDGSLKNYRKKYPRTYDRLCFMDIGSPKTDALFEKEADRDLVLQEMGLNTSLPTICYAPTWERWASLEKHGVEIIEALSSLPINVIVKLHHVSLCNLNYDWIMRDGHGGKDWRHIIGEIEKSKPNLRLAAGQDATPYLIASDLLVSDASGIAYEFILLDRPVIFFDVPELFAHYGKEGIHYWGRESGDVVSDVEQLKNMVMYNLREPAHRKHERAKWMSKICYSRGDATERAGKAILSLMKKPRPPRISSLLS